MCTLSWWRDGAVRRLLFNRDEQRARGRGRGPEVWTEAGARRVLAPVDAEAGGTWTGVNDRGLVAAVVNHYPYHQSVREGQRSRGRLLLDVLGGAEDAGAARRLLGETDPARYRGFLLFVWDGSGGAPFLREWDGRDYAEREVPEGAPFGVLVTSSVRKEACDTYRRELLAHCPPGDVVAWRRAHRHYTAHDPALGPLMEREDAATDSITEIAVEEVRAELRFCPVRGTPPQTGPEERRMLIPGEDGA